ncbi:uncharacterized protein LOC125239169 [Leguminivora glycinivorella]|nr:uncharacterized protein LOC125239169 [Leguminivora glycinivorella]
MKFKGDILKWTEFWDRFLANVHSQSLTDSEKLAYLLSLLEDEAKDAVQGLSITNSNYKLAIEALNARYGNQQKVIDSHYEALTKISCCAYSAEECRKNLNKIDTHLRVLSSLNENVESNFLRSLIMNKFPERVIYELNLLLPNNQTITSIRSTLDAIIVALEKSKVKEPIQRETPGTATTDALIAIDNKPRPKYKRGKRISGFTPFTKPSSEMPSGNNRKRNATFTKEKGIKRPKLSCIFCSGSHFNDECTSIKTIEGRKKRLSDRCFICLKLGHRVNECKRRKPCYHCKGQHNRALCPKREPADCNSAGDSQK